MNSFPWSTCPSTLPPGNIHHLHGIFQIPDCDSTAIYHQHVQVGGTHLCKHVCKAYGRESPHPTSIRDSTCKIRYLNPSVNDDGRVYLHYPSRLPWPPRSSSTKWRSEKPWYDEDPTIEKCPGSPLEVLPLKMVSIEDKPIAIYTRMVVPKTNL